MNLESSIEDLKMGFNLWEMDQPKNIMVQYILRDIRVIFWPSVTITLPHTGGHTARGEIITKKWNYKAE